MVSPLLMEFGGSGGRLLFYLKNWFTGVFHFFNSTDAALNC
jgi:hypothetical protein